MTEQKKKKLIPVGIDDFKELVEQNYYLADKSLLIKEVLDSGAKVTLIPRPRRFGKTLNLSMLRYFFEKVVGERSDKSSSLSPLITSVRFPEEANVSREDGLSRRHLFNGLKIEQHADCMKHQGQYPVIWLTFKDVKSRNWTECYEKTCRVIGAEFKRYFGAISGFLDELEIRQIREIIAGTASQALYESALLDLSLYLKRAYKAKAIILIDEYDAPIHAGYLNGYYNEIIDFMRVFMGAALEGNTALNFGVLTGILRVAKESIFSGMNNLEVCSLVRKDYDDKFGFLEDEVTALFSYFGLEEKQGEVRAWYDGYQSGKYKIYNPWSIINLVKNRGELQAYWVNTSDNALIKDLLRASSPEMKEDLEVLIRGGKVKKSIQENIVMLEIFRNEEVLWNFLLFCGYLTFENYRQEETEWFAELLIPNIEVVTSYKASFKNWFLESPSVRNYTKMLESLAEGNSEIFKKNFERFSLATLSYFATKGDEPEAFYHALVLGMLASLSASHEVRSNRESGYGRYDVMFIPKDRSKPGIVLEFKAVDLDKKETLETAAKSALEQIETNKYEAELRALGLHKILKLGISFSGKESLVLVG